MDVCRPIESFLVYSLLMLLRWTFVGPMKVFVFTVSYCGSSGRLYAYNEGFAVYSLLLLPFATAAQKVVCMPIMRVLLFTVCYCCLEGRLYAYNEGFAVYSLLLLLRRSSVCL